MRFKKALSFLFAGVAAAAAIATNQSAHTLPGTGPQFDPALVMSPEVKQLMTRSCADCHSMTPHLPWYAHVPPASWLLDRDMQHARKAMNLTLWSTQNGKSAGSAIGTLAAMCADVQTGRMPHKTYVWMHPEAKLSKSEVDNFCTWTTEQMARSRPSLPVVEH